MSSVGYGYDGAGRLASLTHDLAGASADQSYGFAYNPASQIVARSGSNDAYASNTAYNVGRGYASNGLNQYTAAGPAAFTYDLNGNLTSDGSTTFVYDAENRLVSASGAKTATLVYDPLGRLWQVSSAANGTTRFYYDGDRLIEEYDGSGNRIRVFGHGPGADEPVVWWENMGGWYQRRLLHADHQGSIVALNDDSGNALNISAYDTWGIPNAGNWGRFMYTGQVWLGELGLYYYKARMYSPTLGRFLQTDPIGYKDQVNLYAYVGNDPVDGRDPTGECQQGATATGASDGPHNSVVIRCSDGYNEHRTGGSRAWRNNNPGNAILTPRTRADGAIGGAGKTGRFKFAVFPDREKGEASLKGLLQGPYSKLSISDAIAKYAPPSENNTKTYQKEVANAVGVKADTLISNLTAPQLTSVVSTIERREGWREGEVTYEKGPK